MKPKVKYKKKNISISNRKAYFEYFIEKTYICGIILKGTEIKSIRDSKVSITESFIYIRDNEVYIKNMYIKEYELSRDNHDPYRDRKLLLNREEIKKIQKVTQQKGYTIVATKLFFTNKNICKIEIGIAKGKKLYDKRSVIKERDLSRKNDE